MKETETKGEEEKTGPGGRDQVGRLRERRVGSDSRGRAHIELTYGSPDLLLFFARIRETLRGNAASRAVLSAFFPV